VPDGGENKSASCSCIPEGTVPKPDILSLEFTSGQKDERKKRNDNVSSSAANTHWKNCNNEKFPRLVDFL